MKAVAFIFARGGSKGLSGKNIRPLAGKPLIGWSIEQAFAVSSIERVIVSTDSLEIAAVAKQFGAEVPFIRPAELALDESPEWLAWSHALNYLLNFEGSLPDIMVSVPTTAPLRLPVDIESCIDEYVKSDVDAVICVTDAHRNPYFNMVKTHSDGTVGLICTHDSNLARRQDAPTVYDVTTVCYALRPEFVLSHNAIFEGRVKAVYVPAERSIDIDTLLDFQIAESLFTARGRKL